MNNKDNTRANAAKFFIDQLDFCLHRNAKVLRRLNQNGQIPIAIHSATQNLFRQAITTVDRFRIDPDSITKTDESNVATLRTKLQTFDRKLINTTCSTRSSKALKHAADDIRHFCQQFHQTLHSFTLAARLPNPPTNHAAQAVWLKQIATLGSSKKIPGWKILNPLVLKATGVDLKERTHRDWLNQLSKGTFFCLIQKRQ
jgi:hypothetical protein